jgi:GHH signature containing HNH/Endo VII superfamily nuclease toxin  2
MEKPATRIAAETNCGAKHGFRKEEPPGACAKCACDAKPQAKPEPDPDECTLYPYRPNCCKLEEPEPATPHHLIPAHCFMPPGQRQLKKKERQLYCENYDLDKAPCICVGGGEYGGKEGKHGQMHDSFDDAEDTCRDNGDGTWTYAEARKAAVDSVIKAFPHKCTRECIEAQLDRYHKSPPRKIDENTKLRADSTGQSDPAPSLTVTSTPVVSACPS